MAAVQLGQNGLGGFGPDEWFRAGIALRHPVRRMPIRRGEHDARSLDVFTQPVAVARNRRQLLALRGAQYHAYLLGHGPRPPTPWPRIAYRDAFVNPLYDSEH